MGFAKEGFNGLVVSWRPAMAVIALFGAIGFLGLLSGMKDALPTPKSEQHDRAVKSLAVLGNRKLLGGALVTVLAYAGSFTAYTYIAPILTEVTGVTGTTVSLYMLIYGVMAAIGNILGGKLTDRAGVNTSNVIIISGVTLVVLSMWIFAASSVAMIVLVGLLGMLTFGAVPALQARLFSIAEKHAPHAHGVASGLNIAGFNSGIALGSVLGSLTITHAGITFTGLTAAVIALSGLMLLSAQVTRSKRFNLLSANELSH